MERDFRRGHLELESAAPPFTAPLALLRETLRLFGARFGFLCGVTLLVYLPGHLLCQLLAVALEVPSSGIQSFVFLEAVDLGLSSLAAPAIVYGLLRGGGIGTAMRWGRRQWMPTLTRQVLVEITVLLYGTLLIVPGLIAMLRLALVPAIVAIEADRQPHPLERSRALTRGRLWRILAVLFPLGLLDLGANFLLLDRFPGMDRARILFAVAESVLALVSQLTTVATLLIYLGLVEAPQRKTAKL